MSRGADDEILSGNDRHQAQGLPRQERTGSPPGDYKKRTPWLLKASECSSRREVSSYTHDLATPLLSSMVLGSNHAIFHSHALASPPL